MTTSTHLLRCLYCNHAEGSLNFIRHGICSSSAPFQPLEQYLADLFKNSTINNSFYNWHDSVLVNGARLANDVLKVAGDRPLVLIGHSMGGLLCRVANVIFDHPNYFLSLMSSFAPQVTYKQTDLLEIANYPFARAKMPKPCLIITQRQGSRFRYCAQSPEAAPEILCSAPMVEAHSS